MNDIITVEGEVPNAELINHRGFIYLIIIINTVITYIYVLQYIYIIRMPMQFGARGSSIEESKLSLAVLHHAGVQKSRSTFILKRSEVIQSGSR